MAGFRNLPLIAALALALPAAALADDTLSQSCDMQARKISGHVPGLIPPVSMGPLTLKITGEVAVGVSNTRGAFVGTPDRGAGQRMMRRDQAEAEYKRLYADCMAGR